MLSIFNYLVAVLLVITSMIYVLSAVLLTYIKKGIKKALFGLPCRQIYALHNRLAIREEEKKAHGRRTQS